MEVNGQFYALLFFSPGNGPGYQSYRRLCGFQSRFERYGVAKSLLFLPGVEPLFLGYVTRSLDAKD
jgi:hypothetical protein